jgi:hypothetical protein
MPIIFYGTKSLTFDEKAGASGAFVPTQGQCPHCGKVSTFVPQRVMRFCHIFWIPLIPISGFTHVLMCRSCGAKFVRRP